MNSAVLRNSSLQFTPVLAGSPDSAQACCVCVLNPVLYVCFGSEADTTPLKRPNIAHNPVSSFSSLLVTTILSSLSQISSAKYLILQSLCTYKQRSVCVQPCCTIPVVHSEQSHEGTVWRWQHEMLSEGLGVWSKHQKQWVTRQTDRHLTFRVK